MVFVGKEGHTYSRACKFMQDDGVLLVKVVVVSVSPQTLRLTLFG